MDGGTENYGYILMKDQDGLRIESFVKRFMAKSTTYLKVHRGELLLPIPKHEQHTRDDGVPAPNYRLRRDKYTMIYSSEDNISPISGEDLKLLEAVESPMDRFNLFASDRGLDWGSKLRIGSQVYVKVPPSRTYAAGIIRYIGPVKTLNGTNFGIEITEEAFRGKGPTDGYFQGIAYFMCNPECGMFVSLDKLASQPRSSVGVPSHDASPSSQNRSYANVASNKEMQSTHAMQTRTRANAVNRSNPEADQTRIKIGNRVGVASKHATIVCGIVRWAGQKTGTRTLPCMHVGIHTDTTVSAKDFESALPGLEHLVAAPKGRCLIVPLSLVLSDMEVRQCKEGPKRLTQETSTTHNRQPPQDVDDTTVLAQTLGTTRTALLAGQADAMHQFEQAKEVSRQKKRQEECKKAIGESVDLSQQQQMLDRFQRTHPDLSKPGKTQSASNLHPHSQNDEHLTRPPMRKQSSQQSPSAIRKLNSQQRAATLERVEGVHKTYPGAAYTEEVEDQHQVLNRKASAPSAAVPQAHLSSFHRSLSKGSTVQLPNQDPPRYGVIHWIGEIPDVQGQVAGIELEFPMEGCTDGSLLQTGKKFFNCEPGKGLYYPLDQLQPDERFATQQQGYERTGNPLDYVPMEEKDDQLVSHNQVEKYLGVEHGIQGHQNSCYLDATVFGLFALNTTFDTMFLEETSSEERSKISFLLWKGIVNNLRKNGVVRFESVMRLRDQLDKLGKMKGIAQDEKDPEEFLNMLFKHTLQIEPFIHIKRPYGIEEEYFVQLFVEFDESLKLPTVGDLLKKMFNEQKISFTQVPSKLLIQVPRFGKQFQTYKKIIPGLNINVGEITETDEIKIKSNCFICGDQAKKLCRSCSDFVSSEAKEGGTYPFFCDVCWMRAHMHPKRASHTFDWCDEVEVLRGLAELDLHSVICIETSHYVCFTKFQDKWVFFDSMANRVFDTYNIPNVVECTQDLNQWVYPADGNLQPLLDTPPRELPEFVRRFTQDVYLCVYVQPDVDMY